MWRVRLLGWLLWLLLPAWAAQPVVTFNDDGGWCWFQDERAIITQGKLVIASVAAGAHDPARRGNVEVVVHDLTSGASTKVVLHERLQLDDHAAPALLVRPDGRILAVYSKHGSENCFYYRISQRPHEASAWAPERSFVPSPSSRITYSNLHYLVKEGRIYNFFRGLDDSFKPSYAWSDDLGETWLRGTVFIQVPGTFRHRPYVKYASDGVDTVHFFYTEGHPRNYDNSVYHVYYRHGRLHRSDGSPIRLLAQGLKTPQEGTCIFKGDANNVAWTSDIELDRAGRPYVAYSVQKGSAGLPEQDHGQDHRYRYARWTGSRWVDHEIAYAGSKLYAGEEDYTGNIALDPADPDCVYISTNVDPATGRPLISRTDGRRHWEIFRGRTRDGGKSWQWAAITRDSTADNIRPFVTRADKAVRAVLWLRGTYRRYTDYDLDVVGFVLGR